MTSPIEKNANPNLDALHGILEEETRQYELVAEKLTRKKESLVANKPQLLTQVDQELITLTQKATSLGKQRTALMRELGYAELTLEKMIQTLDPIYASRFIHVRNRLMRAAQDVERLNRDTRDLLDIALNWIQETVEIIANALTPEASSYNAKGGKAKNGSDAPAVPIQSTINHSV